MNPFEAEPTPVAQQVIAAELVPVPEDSEVEEPTPSWTTHPHLAAVEAAMGQPLTPEILRQLGKSLALRGVLPPPDAVAAQPTPAVAEQVKAAVQLLTINDEADYAWPQNIIFGI